MMAAVRHEHPLDSIRPLPTLREEETTNVNAVETLMQGISISAPKQSAIASSVTSSASSSPSQSQLLLQSTFTTSSKQGSTIPYLPTEIIQEILFYLSPHDYDSARLTCHDWFQAASCRALLERNTETLHKIPGATTRFNHISSKENFSITFRRRYFNTLITEWPGSRHRVPCLKTRLDTRPLLNAASNGSNTSPSDPLVTGFECVGISRQTGSFVALVIGRRPHRKLYICRMFSKTHKTIESRPHRYSNCPCVPEPGPLYMAFDIKTGLNLRIVKVEMEEIDHPSNVKELSITFETGVVETYSFEGLSPHRTYQLNIRDKVVRAAGAAHNHNHGHNHAHNHSQARKHSFSTPTYRVDPNIQQGNKFRGMIHGFLQLFQKNQLNSRNPALLEVKVPVNPNSSSLMRVRVLGREEVCHIIRVPYDREGKNVGIIAVSMATNTVYVCGTTPSLHQHQQAAPSNSRKKDKKLESREDVTTAYMHHWLVPPPRKCGNGEITHVSVAPLMHWDFGQNIGYMGVLVGYTNGEILFWRMSRAWRDLAPGKLKDGESEEQLPPNQYRPDQTPCVSSVIPPPLEPTLAKASELNLPVLNVIPPQDTNEADLADSNAKSWKLAYLPGLTALTFVSRGVVILAADEKFVWGFDLRELYGFEKNVVEPPGAVGVANGLGWGGPSGMWGHGGEVVEGTIGKS